jgi:predicted acylesterase/phospholipase RssA
MSEKKYTLVLAGGSVKGFGMLGAIQYIHENVHTQNIHSYFGTSIGAIISYMLCIGQTPLEIVHSVISTKILDKVQTDISLEQLLTHQGMINFDHFHEELELITLSKHGDLFTMKSLYDTLGKELCCVTFNYTLNKMELLHHTTTPDLPCLIALQMSASIPFVFNRMTYQDCIYIDGGIVDNFPIRIATRMGRENIIAIAANQETDEDLEPSHHLEIIKLLTLPIVQRTRQTIRKYRKRVAIIDIPVSQHILQFDLTVPQIMEMFSIGYKTGKDILEHKNIFSTKKEEK